MVSPVLDLSHHNPIPNWDKIRDAGVVGIIHKCTEGSTYVDKTWLTRCGDAMAAGLKVSTYHFMRPGSTPEQQMAFYIAQQDKLMPLGSRVCLDHEDSNVALSYLENCVNWILTKRPDLQITIYSGHVIKEQLGDRRSETLAKTSLWIAQYTTADNPSWPKGTWPTWSLWQWTDSETIPGISAPVDGDRWNGSPEALLKWFGPAEQWPTPEPVPPPAPAAGKVTIAVEGEVDLVVMRDGSQVYP